MLVVCSDTRPKEPINERSSHQNAGFSIRVFKNFLVLYPGHPERDGTTPSRTHTQPGLWQGSGRKRPGVGTQTLVPLNFQPWLRPWFKRSVRARSPKHAHNLMPYLCQVASE